MIKLVDIDKSTTRYPNGEQTSMRAWNVTRWTSFVAQNGLAVLILIMDDLLIQLDMTSSPRTLIPFWKKNSTKGEKRKDILVRDVSSRSFTKKHY
jgi:hypothetical protein